MKTGKFLLAGATLAGGLWLRKALRRPIPIRDQVVIITGASAGIGRATAHAFAAEGAQVVLAARRAKVLQEVKAELERYDTPVLVVPTDVTNDDDLANLVSETRRVFGRIDILISNAGLGDAGALHEMEPHRLHAVLQVNTHGTFRLTQLVLPVMLEQKCGHIVYVSSLAAHVHVPGVSIYAATKASIVAFASSLRREVSGKGLYVSAILPGAAKTDMMAGLTGEHFDSESGEQSKMMSLFLHMIEDPDALAQSIVDAVRYRKREVVSGGPFVVAMMDVERTAPGLMDFFFSKIDAELFTSIAGNLGVPQSVAGARES